MTFVASCVDGTTSPSTVAFPSIHFLELDRVQGILIPDSNLFDLVEVRRNPDRTVIRLDAFTAV